MTIASSSQSARKVKLWPLGFAFALLGSVFVMFYVSHFRAESEREQSISQTQTWDPPLTSEEQTFLSIAATKLSNPQWNSVRHIYCRPEKRPDGSWWVSVETVGLHGERWPGGHCTVIIRADGKIEVMGGA